MKKLGLVLWCLASFSFAGTMGDESDSGFYAHAGAVLFQPTSTTQGYSILTDPFPIQSPSWQVQRIPSEYQFGFDVGSTYNFKRPGADLRLNWVWLEASDIAAVQASASQFVGPFYEIGPNAGNLRSTAGRLNRKYNFVTLSAGQWIDIGQTLHLRVFGGLDYLYARQNQIAEFRGATNNFRTRSDASSRFSGVGPRGGLSGLYDITQNFGLTALVAGSLSVGQMTPLMTFLTSSDTLLALGVSENKQSISVQKTTQAVPGIEGAIGGFYVLRYKDMRPVIIELGYAAAAFIDAISHAQPATAVLRIQSGSTAVATMSQNNSSFGVNGPYLIVRTKV